MSGGGGQVPEAPRQLLFLLALSLGAPRSRRQKAFLPAPQGVGGDEVGTGRVVFHVLFYSGIMLTYYAQEGRV